MSHAVDLVFRVASPDQEIFETLAEGIDSRVLGSLRSFFKVVDDAGATMRIVEDRREFTLQREEVGRARRGPRASLSPMRERRRVRSTSFR